MHEINNESNQSEYTISNTLTKNKRKIIIPLIILGLIVVIVTSVVFVFVVNNLKGTPSKEKILKDICSISEVISDYSYTWQVKDVSELVAKKENSDYITTVSVELENAQYYGGKKTVDLHYSYYDKGGWILEFYQNVSSISKVSPKTGVEESEARKDLKLVEGEVAEIVSHSTSLDNQTDLYEIDITYNGVAWNEVRTIELQYNTNDMGFWRLEDKTEVASRKEFNNMNYWFYDTYEDLISFYRIDSMTEEKAHITEVYTSVISYDKKYGDITHSYNEGYLSPDHLETDSFVCNKRDCTVTYDDDAKGYLFYYSDVNGESRYVFKWLNRDGLFDYNWLNKKVQLKTTTELSEITGIPIPEEVAKWIN